MNIWEKLGAAWFRPDHVSIVLQQVDGSLVLAVPGGGINVPFTEARRVLAMLGVPPDEVAPAPRLEAVAALPPSGAGHCSRCGKVIFEQAGADTPERWVCQCDPS